MRKIASGDAIFAGRKLNLFSARGNFSSPFAIQPAPFLPPIGGSFAHCNLYQKARAGGPFRVQGMRGHITSTGMISPSSEPLSGKNRFPGAY